MKYLKQIFNSAFLGVFCFISVIAAANVIKDCFAAGAFAVLMIAFFIAYFLNSQKKSRVDVNKLFWPAAQIASALIMTYLMFGLEVSLSWDWGRLLTDAYDSASGKPLIWLGYYVRYPNNRFWFAVLTVLFKCVRAFDSEASFEICKRVSMIFSMIIIQITVFIIYKTAQKIWDKRKAFTVGIVALLFLPFHLYAQFAYTDTPAILLLTCMVYAYVCYKKNGNSRRITPYIIAGCIGILSALVYQIKIMGMIVLIAIIIDAFLSVNTLKKAQKAVISLVVLSLIFVCGVSVTNSINDKYLPISEELSYKYEFPFTHWIMMGLGESGGFDQEDVDFTSSLSTYDEKMDANIAEISKRIADRGFAGTIKHLFVTKLLRTWGVSDLGGADYVNRGTLNTDSTVYDIFALDGDKGIIRDIYAGAYYVLMLIGILLASVFAFRKKKEDHLLFARIAIFGLFLFMTIWECNSRYLLVASPLLIICGCSGWFDYARYLREKTKKGDRV